MPKTLMAEPGVRHHRLSDLPTRMAKAHAPEVRKADPEWKTRVGQAISRVIALRGWTLKEFASAIDRDERQVARWIAGEDRPQFDALFAVESLRRPLVVALAEMAGDAVTVETVVRVTRAV